MPALHTSSVIIGANQDFIKEAARTGFSAGRFLPSFSHGV